jgi:hypothetical protein
MKRCSKCGQNKALNDFHRDKNAPDGHARLCKACANQKAAKWVRDNPDRAKAARQAWGKRNKDQVNQRARERYKKDPTRDLNAKRKYRYGVDETQYQLMCEEQHWLCAICGNPSTRNLHVDHDHATGKIRGLLCGPCNHGLGMFRDDPKRLRAAIRYLLKYR